MTVRRRTGKLIDDAAKHVLYILSREDRARAIVNLSSEVEKISSISWTAVRRRIEDLIEEDLLSEEYAGASRLISITEKGRKVAEKLKEIDRIMEGS